MQDVVEWYLAKHYHDWAGFGYGYPKMGVKILHRPRDIRTGPLLSDGPIGAEEAGAVNDLEVLEEILVRYPECLEYSELV